MIIEVAPGALRRVRVAGLAEASVASSPAPDGPANGPYGFVVGGSLPEREALERVAHGLVRSFFASDGIGMADFRDLSESRQSSVI